MLTWSHPSSALSEVKTLNRAGAIWTTMPHMHEIHGEHAGRNSQSGMVSVQGPQNNPQNNHKPPL